MKCQSYNLYVINSKHGENNVTIVIWNRMFIISFLHEGGFVMIIIPKVKRKDEYCKVCNNVLHEEIHEELINDGFCSYHCEDEYYDLLEERYRGFDRWDSNEGRPF